MSARPVRRHYVDRKPADPSDISRVLCRRAGDSHPSEPGTTPYRHAWTEDRGRVTCPRCLEWLYA